MSTNPEAVTLSGTAEAADPGLRMRAFGAWLPANLHRAAVLALPPVAVSSLLLAGSSDYFTYPRATALYTTYLVVAPVLVGLMWLRRRPASRMGPLLVALGFISWPISWQGSDLALLHTLGVLGAATPIAMSLYLCLAFSTGRLRTAADDHLLTALAFVLTLFFGASLLVSPTLSGEGPLLACGPCPDNPFQIGSQPEFLRAIAKVVTYVGLAVVAGIAAVWIRRFRKASRPQRRTLVPVAASSLLLVPALFVVYFSVLVLGVERRTRSRRSRGCSSACGSCSRSVSRSRSCRPTCSPAVRSASS